MNNYFIILASGQSKRFNSKKPKQFNIYKNKPLFKHSLEKAIKSKLFKKIILVVNNKKSIKENLEIGTEMSSKVIQVIGARIN